MHNPSSSFFLFQKPQLHIMTFCGMLLIQNIALICCASSPSPVHIYMCFLGGALSFFGLFYEDWPGKIKRFFNFYNVATVWFCSQFLTLLSLTCSYHDGFLGAQVVFLSFMFFVLRMSIKRFFFELALAFSAVCFLFPSKVPFFFFNGVVLFSLFGLGLFFLRRIVLHEADRKKTAQLFEHEFITPLQTLRVIAQYMERIFPSLLDQGKGNDYLRRLPTTIRTIATDIETTSRIFFKQEGVISLQRLAVRDVLSEAISLLHLDPGIEEIIKIQGHDQFIVEAERVLLVHVFQNLLKNAFEAVEDRASKRITVAFNAQERSTIVSDNGCGISKENLGSIFDYNYSTKGKKGRGSGLFFSKKVLQAMDVSLECKSKKGEGTQFKIIFPVLQEVLWFQ